MDELEIKRRSELELILGAESVAKFSFYNEVDYDNLTVDLRLQFVSDPAKALKGIRELIELPLAELSRALKGGENSLLYSQPLGQCTNCMDRWQALKKLRKVKGVIESTGGTCAIDLRHPGEDFERRDCDDAELDYLETRLITWM